MKVPAFLGSSFAFLGGYYAIAPKAGSGEYTQAELLPYACLGVACAGLVYLVLAAIIKAVGVNKVMRFFPPVVTGPIIISIGLGLAGSAVTNCVTNWGLALVALALVIVFNIWGKGMAKILPILIGVLGSVAIAVIFALIFGEPYTSAEGATYIAVNGSPNMILFDQAALTNLKEAAWIGFPIHKSSTVLGVDFANKGLVLSSIIAIVPIALATMMEHIGDISAISATCGVNYIKDPGLHRTLLGDGLATTLASLVGGPANTTYGENTGVLVLTKVYDPRVIRIAAGFATILAFCPKFAACIELLPSAVIGGISFILYGMISGAGVRNVVENRVDFSKSRNLIIAAVILVCSLGMTNGISFHIGSVGITLSALATGSIAGILLNAILPGKDYNFEDEEKSDPSAAVLVADVSILKHPKEEGKEEVADSAVAEQEAVATDSAETEEKEAATDSAETEAAATDSAKAEQ
ncbi:MAG TPA: solute carrier family 23 protein, partial [Clostridiales bacterium]|nr:solute carrier family 23 protein [Clostridiales bacterium]